MKIIYKNNSVEKQFNPKYQSKWRYPPKVNELLISMGNFIKNALSLQDIMAYKPYRFHRLSGNRRKEYSLYVGKTGYRITIIPCDSNGKEIVEGDILALCQSIKIIKVTEVSNHYE